MSFERKRGEDEISTDAVRLDVQVLHGFLSTSYWANGISLSVLERSIDNSLCFGVYRAQRQVGFARVISDYATFAYLADVFILPKHRGAGLGTWLIETITEHPNLQGLRRWSLATRDAHSLYRKFGFTAVADPQSMMEKRDSVGYPKSVSRAPRPTD